MKLSPIFISNSGTKIYANKVVLGARCEVMSAMFGGSFVESQSTVSEVQLKEVTSECFMALMEYLYSDHAPIEDGDSVGIMVLADEYGQKRLVNLCELYITKEVDRSVTKQIEKSEIDVIGLLLTSQVGFTVTCSILILLFLNDFSYIMQSSSLTGVSTSYLLTTLHSRKDRNSPC